MKKNELRRIAGLMLWWAEGTKSRRDPRWKKAVSYPVEITNTDPAIVKLFLSFLRKDIHIDESRLKVQLHIHEGDNKKNLEQYWSSATDIPRSRFTKTIIRPQGIKLGKKVGTCKIRYTDKKTHLLMKEELSRILRILGD